MSHKLFADKLAVCSSVYGVVLLCIGWLTSTMPASLFICVTFLILQLTSVFVGHVYSLPTKYNY